MSVLDEAKKLVDFHKKHLTQDQFDNRLSIEGMEEWHSDRQLLFAQAYLDQSQRLAEAEENIERLDNNLRSDNPNEDFVCGTCAKRVYGRILYCSKECEESHK